MSLAVRYSEEYRNAPYEARYLHRGTKFEIAIPERYATLADALERRNSIPPFEFYDDMKDFDPMI